MAQAFDEDGNPLGPEYIEDSATKAFKKAKKEHPDFASIYTRRLIDQINELRKESDKKE